VKTALLILCLSSAALAEQQLPVYPGAVHTRIGNDLVIDGEFYRIAYFTTKDSPKKVARYFYRQWADAGYPVTMDGGFDPEGVVSAFYTREGLQRSIVLTAHAGKTVGFTVLKDLWTRPEVKPAPGLVTLEGTLFSQDLASRGDDASSQQRSAVIAHDVDTTKKELTEALKAKGFELTRESRAKGEGGQGWVVELSHGRDQVVGTLMPIDGGMTAVMETWSGALSVAKEGKP
jgi:hypothetical protein